MIVLNCSSCGAEVQFRSKSSIFAVCSFCQSTLLRRDMDLELLGKMSFALDDLTPIQVGTRGVYDGEPFEILGRMKVGYSDGFWNEWYALFAGEKEGWLAEAQGFYGMCFPRTDVQVPLRAEKLEVGRYVDFGKSGIFEVEDIREVECLLSEGELPMNAAQGRTSTSVDLVTKDAKMATIEYSRTETRVFVGAYRDFDEFEFTNLRKIDGW